MRKKYKLILIICVLISLTIFAWKYYDNNFPRPTNIFESMIQNVDDFEKLGELGIVSGEFFSEDTYVKETPRNQPSGEYTSLLYNNDYLPKNISNLTVDLKVREGHAVYIHFTTIIGGKETAVKAIYSNYDSKKKVYENNLEVSSFSYISGVTYVDESYDKNNDEYSEELFDLARMVINDVIIKSFLDVSDSEFSTDEWGDVNTWYMKHSDYDSFKE